MKNFAPIIKTSRIQVVDILRGFALLGVLLANVPFDRTATPQNELNEVLEFLYDMFINRKFITLFSMLFGFGFYIQFTRAQQKRINFQSYFLKRMGLLFLIGTAHCFLLWNGDIIMSYAIGGVFLLWVRNWSLKQLTWLTVVCSVFLTGVLFIGNAVLGWQQHTYAFDRVLKHPIADSYFEYLAINFRIAPWVNFAQDMPVTLVFTFGNMLLGLILGKLNFFHNPKSLQRTYGVIIRLGLALGLPCSYLFYLVNTGNLELNISLFWLPFVVIGGMMLQTLAYMALFVKLNAIPRFKNMTSWFTYVGRTALSNYIFQSAFYVFVIFHAFHNNGLYGTLSRAQTYMIAVLFFVMQSLISYLWLRKNKQGPIEYLWKRLSYK